MLQIVRMSPILFLLLVSPGVGAQESVPTGPQGEAPGGERVGELVQVVIPIPTRRAESPSAKPSPDHVWVSGYWDRTSGEWRWIGGSWQVPPFEGAKWIRGHWTREARGWRWAKGYWAIGQEEQFVDEPISPPPAPTESRPAPPEKGEVVWVPGHWEWVDGWKWSLGNWVKPPEPGAKWVEGEWVPTSDERWRWVPSHWLEAE